MGLFGKPNVDKLRTKRDVDGLVKALVYEDPGIRLAAALALGELGDPSAASALIPLLSDDDPGVRRVAAQAIQRSGREPEAPEERARYLLHLRDWHGLASIGAFATPALIDELQRVAGEHPTETFGAYFTLSGPEGTTHLFVERPVGDDEVRTALVSALVAIGVPAVQGLIELLQDEDTAVVGQASCVLLEIGEPALRPLLDHYLERGSWPFRVHDERWFGPLATTAAISAAVREAGGSGLLGYVPEGGSRNLEGLRMVAGIAEDTAALEELDRLLEEAGPVVVGAPASLDEEAYVRRCLEPGFVEEEEPRTWRSDPAFASVLEPLNQGDHATASKMAEQVAGRYPDLDLGYSWWGGALRSLGDLDRAREVLGNGIARARRKFLLCGRLGEVEAAAGNLDEAVYWWAQAIHCQETLKSRGGEVGPYLHLHYVADAIGEAELATSFLGRVEDISAGSVRLDTSAAGQLKALAIDAETSEIDEVLLGLRARYLS